MKWNNVGIDHKQLEGTNYSIRRKVINGAKVWEVKNFNTVVGLPDKLTEAKNIVKYELNK